MTPYMIKMIAASKDVALVMSLVFNVIACAAIWRLWQDKVKLEDKIMIILSDVLKKYLRMRK